MKLKKLLLNNFLSYDQAEVDLNNLRKTLIIGMNNDDPTRSNGTGKTNLCEAIGWAVWGKSKAKTLDYNVKEGKDSCSVTLEFEHDGKDCVITRTRNKKSGSSTLDFILDGIPSNSADIEKTNLKIEEFLRLDYDTYINSVYLKQDDIYSLANPQKSGDSRSILEKVLNLDEYDLYEKSTKTKIKELELSNTRLLGMIESNNNVDRDISSNEDLIEELQKESDLIKQKLDQTKSKILEEQNKLDKLKDYENNIKSIQDKIKHIEKISSLTQSQMQEIKKDGGSLKKNIETKEKDLKIKISKEDNLKSEIEKFKEKIKNNDINKKSLSEILNKIEERQKSLSALTEQLTKCKENFSVENHKKTELINNINKTKDRLNNFKLSSGEICSYCLSDITEDGVEHAKQHLSQEINKFDNLFQTQKQICDNLSSEKTDLEAKINNLESSIKSLMDRKDELLKDIVEDEDIEQRKNHYRQQMDLIKQYKNDLENMPEKNTLNSLRDNFNKLKNELSSHDIDLESAKTELENLKNDIMTIEDLKKRLSTLIANEDIFKSRTIHIEADIKNKIEKIKELKIVKRTLDENRKFIENNNTDLDIYNELLYAFSSKGIRAEIVENSILELEKESDALLKKLTGGRLSIQFITKKEVKVTGGEKSEKTVFEVHINDGEKTLPFSLYSGGEKFRISFVLRIALSKLLLRRSNSKLEFLIIDEAVSPLDSSGVEGIMQIIDALQEDFKTILVITHRDDVKSYFDNFITIERDITGSRIVY